MFQYHVYSLFVRASLIISRIVRASVCPYFTEIFTGIISVAFSVALAFCGRIRSPPIKSKSNNSRNFVFFTFFPSKCNLYIFSFSIYHRCTNSGMKFVERCCFSFFQIDAMNYSLRILQSDLKVFFFLWKIALHQNDIFCFDNQDADS